MTWEIRDLLAQGREEYLAEGGWLVVLLVGVLLPLALHGVLDLAHWKNERYALLVSVGGILAAAFWTRYGWTLISAAVTLASSVAAVKVWWPLLYVIIGHVHGRALMQAAKSTVDGGLGFLLVMAVFCLAVCCGWFVFLRKQPWPAALLIGVAFLVRADHTQIYEDRFPLIVLALATLVILGYAPRLSFRPLLIPAMVLGCGVVAICWQLPVARSNFIPPLAPPVVSFTNSGSGSEGGHTLSLSGPFRPSNRPLMDVTVQGGSGQPYWRSLAFSRYDGHSWSMNTNESLQVPAGQLLPVAQVNSRTIPVSATVRVLQATRSVISPGSALRTDVDAVATYERGENRPSQIQTAHDLTPGAIYRVDGDLASGGTPPSSDLYLQLPVLPDAVKKLARGLVVGHGDALSQALAIQTFLRDSGVYQYDANTGSPLDGDAVSSFLFESHRGYCNQFASAMVVLAREAGLSARLVSGYETGQLMGVSSSGTKSTYLVRARDAHSWVEVYVPGSGWDQFDPTPGFRVNPQVSPPGKGTLLPAGKAGHGIVPPRSPSGQSIRSGRSAQYRQLAHHSQQWGPLSTASSGALTMFLFLFFLFLVATALYTVRPRPLRGLYLAMTACAPPNHPGMLPDNETPLEFMDRFRSAPGARDGSRAQECADISLIAGLYMRQTYAREPASADEVRAAWRAWLRLRGRWSVVGRIIATIRAGKSYPKYHRVK